MLKLLVDLLGVGSALALTETSVSSLGLDSYESLVKRLGENHLGLGHNGVILIQLADVLSVVAAGHVGRLVGVNADLVHGGSQSFKYNRNNNIRLYKDVRYSMELFYLFRNLRDTDGPKEFTVNWC